jgi:hypothetical protein
MLVLELVTDALRDIGVLAEIDTPSAEQGADAVRKLNELMAALAEDGVDLGYAPIADTASTVEIPLGHVGAIKAMLGMACAPLYGADVPASVAYVADRGRVRLLGLAFSLAVERAQSDTLPSGNGQSGRYDILNGNYG